MKDGARNELLDFILLLSQWNTVIEWCWGIDCKQPGCAGLGAGMCECVVFGKCLHLCLRGVSFG